MWGPSLLSTANPVFDYEEKLRNDGTGDMSFVAVGIRGRGHFAVSPAAKEFKDCDRAVEHFIHGDIGLFCAVAFHEFP